LFRSLHWWLAGSDCGDRRAPPIVTTAKEQIMRKANELLGKSIVNRNTGERIAAVRDLLFNTDATAVAAILVDDGGWFRDARVICWDHVASIADVVMVQGEQPITKASETPELREQIKQDIRLTGMPIVTEAGERIGTVGDLYIDDNGTVVGYEIKQGFMSDLGGRKFLFADHVRAIGHDALIADTADLPSVKQALSTAERPQPGAPLVDAPSVTPVAAPHEAQTIVGDRTQPAAGYDPNVFEPRTHADAPDTTARSDSRLIYERDDDARDEPPLERTNQR
jgi:uncharacterized protein YrrD